MRHHIDEAGPQAGFPARRARPMPLILRPTVHAALVAASVASWVTLTMLSLLPGSERPHTGFSGDVEHAMAYALSAGVTRLCLFGLSSRTQLAGYALAAAFFEVCQVGIPGRTAGVDNWLASTTGALIGIALARLLSHRSLAHAAGR